MRFSKEEKRPAIVFLVGAIVTGLNAWIIVGKPFAGWSLPSSSSIVPSESSPSGISESSQARPVEARAKRTFRYEDVPMQEMVVMNSTLKSGAAQPASPPVLTIPRARQLTIIEEGIPKQIRYGEINIGVKARGGIASYSAWKVIVIASRPVEYSWSLNDGPVTHVSRADSAGNVIRMNSGQNSLHIDLGASESESGKFIYCVYPDESQLPKDWQKMAEHKPE